MNNLLLTTLIIAGLVWFIYQQKPTKSANTFTKSTQTEIPINPDNPELEKILDQLIKNIRQLNQEI